MASLQKEDFGNSIQVLAHCVQQIGKRLKSGRNAPKSVVDLLRQGGRNGAIFTARKPIDYITLKKKDPVFYEEISHGLTLWEKK